LSREARNLRHAAVFHDRNERRERAEPMNVFQLLAKDRVAANTLLNEFMGASDTERRLSLYSQLRNEVEMHVKAEEACLYSALERHPETSKFVQEALDEHDRVKKAFAAIDAVEPEGSRFREKIRQFEQLLQHHFREEESEMFPTAERTLSEQESVAIAERIQALKQGAREAAAE
jgi:hemerythrin-like domain-containing protein